MTRFAKLSIKLRKEQPFCKFCRHDQKLECCHIVPRSWLSRKNDKRFHDPNNLIILCRNCHISFDRFVGVLK